MKGLDLLIKTNVALLRERVEQNYAEYKKMVLKLSGESIFEVASEISAVRGMYLYVTAHDYIYEGDAAVLLKYKNPLKTLVDAWGDYTAMDEDDFCGVVSGIVEVENDSGYMDMPLVYELREKYGGKIPLETACLIELLQLGKSILTCGLCKQFDELYEKNNKGAGF